MAMGASGYIESGHLQRGDNSDIYDAKKTETLLRGTASFIGSIGKAAEGLNDLLGPSAADILIENGRIGRQVVSDMEAANSTEEMENVLSKYTEKAQTEKWRDVHVQTVATIPDKYLVKARQADAITKKNYEMGVITDSLAVSVASAGFTSEGLSGVFEALKGQGINVGDVKNITMTKTLNILATDLANTGTAAEYKAKLEQAKVVINTLNTPQYLENQSPMGS